MEPESPVLLVDRQLAPIQKLLQRSFHEAAKIAVGKAKKQQDEFVRRSGMKGSIAGEEAHSFLSSVVAYIRERLIDATSGYSPQQWLWSCRRFRLALHLERLDSLPHVTMQLVEMASRKSRAPVNHVGYAPSGDYVFDFDESFLRRITLTFAYSMCFERAMAALSHVALNGRCSIRADGVVVQEHDDGVLYRRSLYSQRLPNSKPSFLGLGIVISHDDSIERCPAAEQLTYLARYDAPTSVTVPRAMAQEITVPNATSATFLAQYAYRAASLSEIADADSSGGGWLGDVALSHIFGQLLLGVICTGTSLKRFLGLTRYGYHTMLRDQFLQQAEAYFEDAHTLFATTFRSADVPTTMEALVANLSVDPPDDLSLYGRPVIIDDTRVMVDFWALTQDMQTLCQFPRDTGSIAKARSIVFEKQVQKAIDNSLWQAGDVIRSLVGRTLKIDGHSVTDVDSIGCLGETLLLVSCKSILLPYFYTSDHRLLRNINKQAQDAVTDWRCICSRIMDRPIGDNYDLSAYSKIIPVVCVPKLLMLARGVATEFAAPNLFAVCSYDELVAWLSTATQ